MNHLPSPYNRLSVVVVAFGQIDVLEASLRPLQVLSGARVVVVDNAGDPGCRQLVESMRFDYVDPGTNLGFGAGVNTGVAHLRCPLNNVLLLNPDAVVSADAIIELLHQLSNSAHRLAAVAPRQRDPATGAEHQVAWPWPTPWGAWLVAVGLGRRSSSTSGFLTGAVLLLSAEAFVDVGGFDERFFLYAEETDWQRRATRRGWDVRLVDTVWATHVGAATSSDSARREFHFHAGTEIYIRKHYGSMGWLIFRSGAIFGACARAILFSGERRRTAGRRAILYCRGPVAVRAAAGA